MENVSALLEEHSFTYNDVAKTDTAMVSSKYGDSLMYFMNVL